MNNQEEPPKKRVFLLEDDLSLLTALQHLLLQKGYDVVAFSQARDFLAWLDAQTTSLNDTPCCVILDVHLPDLTGIEVQQYLLGTVGHWPIIFISGTADAPTIIDAWRNGATDFLLKPFEISELLQGLERVFAAPSAELPASDPPQEVLHQQFMLLTPRERQVLALVAEGNTNVVISQLLELSLRTVKMHRGNLMQKLGYKHVADLVRFHEKCRGWL